MEGRGRGGQRRGRRGGGARDLVAVTVLRRQTERERERERERDSHLAAVTARCDQGEDKNKK